MATTILAKSSYTLRFRKYLSHNSLDVSLPYMAIDSGLEVLEICKAFCNGASPKESLTLIIGIDDSNLLLKLNQIFQREHLVQRPKLIVLSSFETWSRSDNNQSIQDASVAFIHRKPSYATCESYLLENRLWETAITKGLELYIFGIGLIYGDGGFSLQSIFKSIFDVSEVSVPCCGDGSNKIPMIYYKDFVRLVHQAVTSSTTTPQYIPCSDGNSQSIAETVSNYFKMINGSAGTLKYMSEAEYSEKYLSLDFLAEDFVWNLNISFNAPSILESHTIKNMSNYGTDIWKEFLFYNKMDPCSIVVCGGPKSGKSELAKLISDGLKVPYIDMIASVKSVLNATEEGSEKFALRSTIIAAIEAKQLETKKPKKGEEIKPLDVATLEVTFDLCSSLSADLLRSAVKSTLSSKFECARFGFVLDIWEYGIIGTSEELTECTKVLPAVAPSASFEVHPPSPASENVDLIEVTGTTPPIATNSPELLIEIASADSAVVRRAMTALGIAEGTLAKASKDNQAAIKALEAQLATYAGLLQDNSSGGEDAAKTHPVVLSFENNAGNVFRMGGELPFTTSVAESIAKFKTFHGPIGWLSDPIEDSSSSDSSATDSSPVENDLRSTVTIAIPDTAVSSETNFPSKTYDSLNTKLKVISGDDMKVLKAKCSVLEEYLIANVLPQITQVMVDIARNRPEDPIAFMANQILQKAESIQKDAETHAYNNFYSILNHAEGRSN